MPDLIIEAGRTERQYWRDIWRYRELFYFLAWRDLLVRYKQTIIGIAWSVIRPFLTMLVLVIVFGAFGKMPDAGVPYPVLVFCGLLPWQFFSTAFSESGNSLISNSNLISKIYFPRLVIPASSVITSFVDFIISAFILVGLMVWYHYVPSANVYYLPIFVFLAFAASFGAGLWIAALMVKYRDFKFIVPFIVQFGLYISPVGFLSSVVPAKWRFVYSLNPVVGIIDGFRWCILNGHQVGAGVAGSPPDQQTVGFKAIATNAQDIAAKAETIVSNATQVAGNSVNIGQSADQIAKSAQHILRSAETISNSQHIVAGSQPLYWPGLALSVAGVIFLVASGVWYFRKTERTFADVI